jgi:acetyltransferase-like isoleucine patch superfamily enzyme
VKIDTKQYEKVIVYGIGQYYESIKTELFQYVKPNFLCDRKWDNDAPEMYDGIPILRRENLDQLGKILVIITTGVPWTGDSIKEDLKNLGDTTMIHVNEIVHRYSYLDGKSLKEHCKEGSYQDSWGNRIDFDSTIPDTIAIVFYGKNNRLQIGRNVVVGELTVSFGNEGVCVIGDRSEVIGGYFAVSGAKLKIGRDSLISTKVLIQNHDGHHIFDLETHKRINYPRDIIIGDRVWIGYRAVLLAGAKIGRGSIVGANAVTSGRFGENQIIAGCPAKVIREGVCWSKDNTDYFNYDYLEERT